MLFESSGTFQGETSLKIQYVHFDDLLLGAKCQDASHFNITFKCSLCKFYQNVSKYVRECVYEYYTILEHYVLFL